MDSRTGKPMHMQAFHSGSILADVFTGLLLVSLGFVLGMICNANFPESYLVPHSSLQQPLTTSSYILSSSTPAPSPETACVGPRSPSPAPRMEFADFLAPSAGGGGGGLMHNMTDEELLWRASMEPRRVDASMPHGIVHKVAFLFLVTADLPLRPLWEKFFAGHEGLYSIYVHARPGYYAGSPPGDSVFYGRMIPSQNTSWGTMSLVDAERRLLGNALLDLANTRFALFSESCAPLLSFPAVYAHLTGSRASFVESYDRPVGRLRHWRWFTNRGVSLEHWRKGSQWFQMHRQLAAEFVAEARYINVFKGGHGKNNMEEHYLPTLVTLLGWGARSQNRSLTNVDWSHSRGGHPLRYNGGRDVTAELIERLRKGEGNCGYNGGVADFCYMFARKFAPDTLGKLLELAPKVMGFG